jgi:hypothetical protein
MLCALVTPENEIVRYEDRPDGPVELAPRKGRWLAVTDNFEVAYGSQILDPEVVTITANGVSRTRLTRDLTVDEIAGELASTLQGDLTKIDTDAELCRLKFVTPGSGQAMTYLRKEEQARAWVAAGRPEDATAYPFLTMEAAVTAQTVGALADTIIANAGAWGEVIGPGIEALRIGAKTARRAATTLAQRAVAVTIDWPVP